MVLKLPSLLPEEKYRYTAVAAIVGLVLLIVLSALALSYDYLKLSMTAFVVLFGGLLSGILLLAWQSRRDRSRNPESRNPAFVRMLLVVAVLALAGSVAGDLRVVYTLICLAVLLHSAGYLGVGNVLSGALLVFCIELLAMINRILGGNELVFMAEWFRFGGLMLALAAVVSIGAKVDNLCRVLRQEREHHQQIVAQWRQASMTDELTDLPNRRYLIRALRQDIALAERGSYTFSVCYADLDRFKHLNDRFGHARGDRVLKDFARIILNAIRAGDYVARVGGDEFVMILVDANLDMAGEICERIRAKIAALPISNRAPGYNITTSVGVVQYQEGEHVDAILSRADEALYQAKRKGRNRVMVP